LTRQQQSVAFCSAQDNPAVCGQARRRCDNQSHVRFSARTRDQGVRSVRTLRSVRDLLRQKRYYYVRSGVSRTGADPASKFRGRAISVIFGSQVSLRVHNCKSDEVYFTALLRQKQWTTKWPYIVNAVFQIVQNHGEKVTFVGYRGGGRSPQSSPWVRSWFSTQRDGYWYFPPAPCRSEKKAEKTGQQQSANNAATRFATAVQHLQARQQTNQPTWFLTLATLLAMNVRPAVLQSHTFCDINRWGLKDTVQYFSPWASARGGKTGIIPWEFRLGTFKAFCERPFVLKPDKDRQNVDVSPFRKKLSASSYLNATLVGYVFESF